MKIITGVIPASINGDQEIVYIFRLGGIKIANIYENGKVAIKAKIPAITKTEYNRSKARNKRELEQVEEVTREVKRIMRAGGNIFAP